MSTKELAQRLHPFELSDELPPKERLDRSLDRLNFVGQVLWVYSLAFPGDAEQSTMFTPASFARVLAEINGEAIGMMVNLVDEIRFETGPSSNGPT